MCDVLDKVENRGKAEGADSVALLMKKLFDQNRIEDAKRASEDKEYRTRLMKRVGHQLKKFICTTGGSVFGCSPFTFAGQSVWIVLLLI